MQCYCFLSKKSACNWLPTEHLWGALYFNFQFPLQQQKKITRADLWRNWFESEENDTDGNMPFSYSDTDSWMDYCHIY